MGQEPDSATPAGVSLVKGRASSHSANSHEKRMCWAATR